MSVRVESVMAAQREEKKTKKKRRLTKKILFCLFGFLTSSSTTRLYRGRAPRQFYVVPHTKQSWETMTSVSACHIKPILHQSRTAHRARRNTCKLSQPMDATVQHCPATVPAVTGIDRPKLGQRRSSGLTVHTTDEARTALRLSKLRSIKILYTLTMIYDSLYI